MGSIQSVSLPSVVTCRKYDCQKKCYARKLERLRPSVRAAYANNIEVLKNEPDTYWREVEAAIMTRWRGLAMNNPFHLPEAHVKYRDGSTTASPKAKPCGGNCTECAITDGGCWTLDYGEQVVFNEH